MLPLKVYPYSFHIVPSAGRPSQASIGVVLVAAVSNFLSQAALAARLPAVPRLAQERSVPLSIRVLSTPAWKEACITQSYGLSHQPSGLQTIASRKDQDVPPEWPVHAVKVEYAHVR